MEESISLKEIIDVLKKRLAMIVSITMIAVIAAASVSYFVLTPKYQASTQVLVSQAATGASILSSANPFESDARYIETYSVILKSPYILDQVVDELELEESHRSLNTALNVQQEGGSQVVTISIEDTDPSMAVSKANATAEVFRNEIETLLNIDNIHILSPADLADSMNPVSPNPELNIAIRLVVGLMGAVGLAFLLEFLDNTIRTEDDLDKTLGLPVLGAVTIMDQEEASVDDRMKPSEKGREKHGVS
ncbi:YveK family protein [Salisediminibacterium selenitireducens]|uniref:Lipopolysaccharide biosynthesis protein n=1 Tax=Bacillus selenitireducens (strain ATCC 700615 / DSM 15326 / MLS10) TaxID=439292 RepID=D6Y035_BACIE|nr:Wzz/FepE/Etk N-terminal domain-containing protein [Salisediminibacterium selenitireducens]ADI00537.1 lipopolysaccharide biosynthesis protein [[Bacillus] selenitireducens MLS10]